MCISRNPIHCIVPPHVLRALAQHSDATCRELALRAIMTGSPLRGRRQVLGQVTLAAVADGKKRTVYDTRNTQGLPGNEVRDEGEVDTQDASVNEAYDALGATYDLYKEIFDRDSIDNHGLRLVATIHYGSQFANAFWDGQQMVFGDGDGTIFLGFTGSVDVIGHELTHGVTQYSANLKYQNQSGALNESFSDVFGSLVKQYHNGQTSATADWLIGQGILGPTVSGVALRSLKDPGSAYDDGKLGGKDPQPGKMDDYVQSSDDDFGDFGGVHINSGIPNKAFYQVASQLGGNAWEDAGHVWYETLVHRLGPDADFQACSNATFSVAGELFGTGSNQQKVIKDAWAEVGVPVVVSTSLRATKTRRPSSAVEANGAVLKKQIDKVVQELKKLGDLID